MSENSEFYRARKSKKTLPNDKPEAADSFHPLENIPGSIFDSKGDWETHLLKGI